MPSRAISILLVVLLLVACNFCPKQTDIYFEAAMLAGERISIQKLDEEIRRCPKTRKYKVFWKEFAGNEEKGRRALIYERFQAGNDLGQEDDPGSGYSSAVLRVDDAMIHELALKGGTFDDLTKYAPRAY